MAQAVCVICGKQFYWYAGRGRRLADVHCPACGGAARAPQRSPSRSQFRWASVRLPVRFAYYGGPVVFREKRVQVRTRKGTFQLGNTFNQYIATDEVEDGWRKMVHYRCADECFWKDHPCLEHNAFVREEDFQRLINEGQ